MVLQGNQHISNQTGTTWDVSQTPVNNGISTTNLNHAGFLNHQPYVSSQVPFNGRFLDFLAILQFSVWASPPDDMPGSTSFFAAHTHKGKTRCLQAGWKRNTKHRKVTSWWLNHRTTHLKNMLVELDHAGNHHLDDWPKTQQKRTSDLKGYSGEHERMLAENQRLVQTYFIDWNRK